MLCSKKVLVIYGLPGSGKTTLARKIQGQLNCPWYNADRVRDTLSSDLGFSFADRLEQARRMGSLALLSAEQPSTPLVLVDFVCPTYETYNTFKQTIVNGYKNSNPLTIVSIFMDTIKPEDSRFADTAKLAEYTLIDRNPDLVFKTFIGSEQEWVLAVQKTLFLLKP